VPARARALAVAVVLLALAPASAAAATFANPVLPGDHPDPSVVRVGGAFWATATSDRWAPALPILHSRDLVTWRQVGAALPAPPAWVAGGRIWAPEITWSHGRFVILYAGLRRPGRFCIGAVTAVRGTGPWIDRGPLTCRRGGAIDPVAVRREDGTDWLVWKAKGVGGGLWAQEVDLAALEVVGRPVPLIAPERPWERGVTEGPSFVKRGPWWYLVYAGGTCCRPPCTYVTAVARAPALLGPYEKAREPILRSGPALRCPGHGTLVDLPDGRLFFLHHAYVGPDQGNRRRQGVLTRAWVDADGWLAMGDDGVPEAAGQAPLGQGQAPGPAVFADDFRHDGLVPGWQWIIRRVPPRIATGTGALALQCGTHALVTRQVAADAFRASVTVLPAARRAGRAAARAHTGPARDAPAAGVAPAGALPPQRAGGGGLPALVVRETDGTLRGVEVRDGRVLGVRRAGAHVRLGPSVRVPRRAPVRLTVTVAPDGTLAASVRSGGATVPVPAGPAAAGAGPTRVGLACRGTGLARFARLRTAALEPRPLGVPAAAPRTAGRGVSAPRAPGGPATSPAPDPMRPGRGRPRTARSSAR
jgi:hypothetical protein